MIRIDEVKELHKGIQDILVAIGKIETEIKHLSSMSTRLENAERLVLQIEQSVKSAHKRIDSTVKDVEDLEKKFDDASKESKADKKWLLGFFLGAATLIWKFFDLLNAKH